ncbi:hypothetical protein [Prescottella equi]
MSERTIRCDRCRRRWRGNGDWNVTVESGNPVGITCPNCQTVEENTEAVINEATIDYLGFGPDGRLFGVTKGVEG